MTIDAFCHIVPQKLIKAYVATQIPQLFGFVQANVAPDDRYFSDDEFRIKYMDKYKIDMEVLSFSPPVWETLPQSRLLGVTKIANDAYSEVVSKHPDRMIGIASISNPVGEQLDEVDRAIGDLGLRGCLLYSNIFGKPLDSPEFVPFYEKMVKYDLPVFIHPTFWKYYDWIYDYRLANIFGWPFDSSLAVARLVFGGVFDRLPNLKVIVHHLGGMIPFFSERIRGFYDEALSHAHIYGSHFFPNANKGRRDPMEYFKSIYGDTVVNGNISALKCGLDFFGPDHVVFATDYPFGPEKGELWTREILKNIADLKMSKEDESKVFEGNIKHLLKMN